MAGGCTLFLYDLQSPINLGQILRTGEQFQLEVVLYDPRHIFTDPERRRTIADFSCGALNRRPPKVISGVPNLKTLADGRVVATCLRPSATRLNDFHFQPGDMIVLGNEYDGLPAEVIDRADAALYIPLPHAVLPKPPSFSSIDSTRIAPVSQDGVPNLNVAMTASIIGYASYLQRMRNSHHS